MRWRTLFNVYVAYLWVWRKMCLSWTEKLRSSSGSSGWFCGRRSDQRKGSGAIASAAAATAFYNSCIIERTSSAIRDSWWVFVHTFMINSFNLVRRQLAPLWDTGNLPHMVLEINTSVSYCNCLGQFANDTVGGGTLSRRQHVVFASNLRQSRNLETGISHPADLPNYCSTLCREKAFRKLQVWKAAALKITSVIKCQSCVHTTWKQFCRLNYTLFHMHVQGRRNTCRPGQEAYEVSCTRGSGEDLGCLCAISLPIFSFVARRGEEEGNSSSGQSRNCVSSGAENWLLIACDEQQLLV